MPLTDDAKALKSRIDTFVASGTTGGHIGTQWAWYMLSPKWNALFDKNRRLAQSTRRRPRNTRS